MSEGGEVIAPVAEPSCAADARMPVRPAIPMTLWGLVAVILAERAVLRFGMQLSLVLLVVTAVAGVCLCLLATFAIWSLSFTLLDIFAIASTATSVAFFIPLRRMIGLAPASRFFIPS